MKLLLALLAASLLASCSAVEVVDPANPVCSKCGQTFKPIATVWKDASDHFGVSQSDPLIPVPKLKAIK